MAHARITPEPYRGRSTLGDIASYTSVFSGHMLCTKRKCLKWPDEEVYCYAACLPSRRKHVCWPLNFQRLRRNGCPDSCPCQMIKFGSLAGGHCKRPSYSSSPGWDASRRQVLVFTPTAYTHHPSKPDAARQHLDRPLASRAIVSPLLGRVWPSHVD